MKLGIINLEKTINPIIIQQIRSSFNMISHDFIQEKLKDTRSRSRAVSKINARNFESESKRSEYLSDRNLITERFKPSGDNVINENLFDAMSLPDNHAQESPAMIPVHDNMMRSQPIPKLSLKNNLVTKTQDHGK